MISFFCYLAVSLARLASSYGAENSGALRRSSEMMYHTDDLYVANFTSVEEINAIVISQTRKVLWIV